MIGAMRAVLANVTVPDSISYWTSRKVMRPPSSRRIWPSTIGCADAGADAVDLGARAVERDDAVDVIQDLRQAGQPILGVLDANSPGESRRLERAGGAHVDRQPAGERGVGQRDRDERCVDRS